MTNCFALVKKNGKKVAIGFQYLYSKVVQHLKTLLSQEDCGRIKRVRALGCWIRYDWYYRQVPWLGRLAIDGKWVLDGSINNPLAHMLSAALYLGTSSRDYMAQPQSVKAQLYSGHKIEGEDTASLRIITDEDVEIITNTTLCPDVERDVEIVVECENLQIRYINFERAVIIWDSGEQEEISDDMDHRTYMLDKIGRDIKRNKIFDADLQVCRPFTLTVNSAYESSRKVYPINDEYIRETNVGGHVKTIIQGVDDAIEYAHTNGLLLSETSVPWAVDTAVFDTEGYDHFPLSDDLKKVMDSEAMLQGCR